MKVRVARGQDGWYVWHHTPKRTKAFGPYRWQWLARLDALLDH